MIDKEQAEKIKQQIIQQIKSWNANEEQKEQALEQVLNFNEQELEEFLSKNKLVKQEEKCPFCSIIQGKIPAYKLDENKNNLAILEINPLSTGHSLIVSKTHSSLSSSAFSFANKLSKRIKSRLKPADVKIETAEIAGHKLINLVPLYKNEKLERKKADEKQLILLQEKLKTKPREKPIKKLKPEKTQLEHLEKAPVRFP